MAFELRVCLTVTTLYFRWSTQVGDSSPAQTVRGEGAFWVGGWVVAMVGNHFTVVVISPNGFQPL